MELNRMRLSRLFKGLSLAAVGLILSGLPSCVVDPTKHPFDSGTAMDSPIGDGPAVKPADGAQAQDARPCTVVKVNDNTTTGAHSFSYAGSWSVATGSGKYQGDDHYSTTTDDAYTVSFRGARIELYAATAPHHGIAAVSLDGAAEQDVDFYSAVRADQVLLYASPMLAAGVHTLEVRVTGRKNAASSGTVVTADRVDVCETAVPADGGSKDSGKDGPTADGAPPTHATMYVQGSALYDRCGEKVVLRGANAGIAFPSDPQAKNLAQLAKTGANAVRLTFRVQYNNSSPTDVDTALAEARKNGMIPIPALWDATGDWSKLGFCVDFWVKPAMVTVLKKHEAYTLLNMANEAGDSSVTDTQYRQAYTAAINKVRAAGLKLPLVIDAGNWGRGEAYIMNNAAYLLAQDPEKNLVFSWHPWDTNQPQSRYQKAFSDASSKGICMIVGEFASVGVNYSQPILYATIMQLAQQGSVGWLWWWWHGGDQHALTTDGQYGNWANVGQEVCITSSYGIQQTSVRTYDLVNGSCK